YICPGPAPAEIYTLSLHDALPIYDYVKSYNEEMAAKGKSRATDGVEVELNGEKHVLKDGAVVIAAITSCTNTSNPAVLMAAGLRSEEHTSELQSRENLVCRLLLEK